MAREQELLNSILDSIANPTRRKEAAEFFNSILKNTNDVTQAFTRTNTVFGRGLDTVQEMQDAIRATRIELGETNLVVNLQKQAYRQVSGVLDKIRYSSAGIADYSVKQLEKEKQIVKEANERLTGVGRQDEELTKIVALLDEQITHQENINKTIGLTGAAFDNLNRIGQRAFGGLGINLGALEESFKDVTVAIRKKGEEIVKATEDGEELGTISNRFKTFGAALKPLGKGLKDVFTDPLILLKGIADAFFDINKASVALGRETGQGIGNFDSLNTRAATTVDLMEVIVEASKETGLNIQNVFSADVLAGAAEFKRTMAGSAEEAAGLLDLTAATGMSTDAILQSTVETVNAFNGANRAAISQRGVMRDVLSASTAVKASLAGNPKALAQAAAAARRLGLSLQEVDSIADSLLDFESSINSELEAQLLTGRSLNLSKARELALNNDLAGLSNEIFKNQVSVAEFSQMNRIQQEGLAKALGMNRDQLAKMAFQQAKLNGLTDKQAAAAAGVSLEEMQRVEIQENFQMALQKTLQAFEPILSRIGDFLSMPFVPQLLVWGTIAAKTFLPIVGYLGSATRAVQGFTFALSSPVKGIQTAWSSLTGLVTKAWTVIKDAWTGARLSKIQEAAAETASTAAKAGNTAATASQTVVESANTAAKTANTAATTSQTAANAALATSQTAVGTTGVAASAGFASLAAGIAALNAAGAPILLASIGLAALGVGAAFAGIGFGVKMAAEGFVLLFSTLTLDQIKVVAAAAVAFTALGGALAVLGAAGLVGLPMLITLVPVLAGLGAVVGLGAAGDAGEAEGQNSMAKVEEKLDLLISAVKEDKKIFIDGRQLEEVITFR